MKTKEEKSKTAKKTDDKKEENISLYMPKTTTMELIMSLWYNGTKNMISGIDVTIDEITGKCIDKKIRRITQKYTIPFSEEEARKEIDYDDIFFVDDENIVEHANANAEQEECSFYKMIPSYNILFKNKKYSLLDFCKDMDKGIGYHFDLRTAGSRLFDYERYKKDAEEKYRYGEYRDYHLDFCTLLSNKGFYITIKDRKELKKCLRRYIDWFMEDKLTNKEFTNIYNYKTHLKKAVEFFQKDYEEFGKFFTIDCEEYKNKDKKFRLIECLLALQKQKYIKINTFLYKDEKLNIHITFLKNPKAILNEIEALEKKNNRWIEYGDLKVDKELGLAQYKDNPIKKFNKSSNKFKVLCYLIEHPNKVIHIDKLIEITKLKKDFQGYIKAGRPSKEIKAKIHEQMYKYMEKIKGYTIDIQQELGITKDEKRTIQISQSKPGFILHKK